MSQWSPGMTMVGEMFKHPTQGQAGRTVHRHRGPPGCVGNRRWGTLRGRRGQLPLMDPGRRTGGRPDWGGRARSARRTISATRSSRRPVGL
jgi:hypothetical protein